MEFGHKAIKDLVNFQLELIEAVGKTKIEVEQEIPNEDLIQAVTDFASENIKEANRTEGKEERDSLISEITSSTQEELKDSFPEHEKEIGDAVYELVKSDMRTMIIKEKRRIDGRALDEVRLVTCETQLLPRTHGSALFTRGQNIYRDHTIRNENSNG